MTRLLILIKKMYTKIVTFTVLQVSTVKFADIIK